MMRSRGCQEGGTDRKENVHGPERKDHYLHLQKLKKMHAIGPHGCGRNRMGNVGDKILKHHLVADKTLGTEDITTTAWWGDARTYSDRNGTVWCDRSDHSVYKPK